MRRAAWGTRAGLLAAGATAAAVSLAAPGGAATTATEPATSYLVLARSGADYASLAQRPLSPAKVVDSIPELNVLVMDTTPAGAAALGRDRRALSVAVPGQARITTTDATAFHPPGPANGRAIALPAAAAVRSAGPVNPDPALDYKGLLWDYGRIGAPQAWRTTAGSKAVTVGVADTGLDFTHSELRPNITSVQDFTTAADRRLCRKLTGYTDEQLAAKYGGPATTDWNGHGSWIGGNIAAALNGKGTNGIAPKVNLVALKIAQNCGSDYGVTILKSFIWAANHHLDVVSISFGGYTDRSTRAGEQEWQLYRKAVAYARAKGTTIVASAGNEHVRLDPQGRVISHGYLNTPGGPYYDAFGASETPAGVPGVVAVSATGNVVVPSSAHCPAGSTGSAEDRNATCKPSTDRHQAAGAGLKNQLAYYSNYGPRIDLAAPGGARKFNLPYYDRGGTPGFPVTDADLTTAFEEFSTTSNWATEIPCYTFTKTAAFPSGQCYSTIQGTSMATPHVSAAAALVASAHPALRGDVSGLIRRVKADVVHPHNRTQVLSATDTSAPELEPGTPCAGGYCHLGGPAVSDADAYGAGLLNIATP